MTAALYDQDLLDDPETPVFNAVLDLDCELINLLIDGEYRSPDYPDFLECAFEVPADEFSMDNIHVPTVEEIEEDIDAGRVPLLDRHWGTTRKDEIDPDFPEDPPSEPDDEGDQDRHRASEDEEHEPEEDAARLSADCSSNRDS